MPSPAPDLDLAVLEDLYEPPVCESSIHTDDPTHLADWYWSFCCGFTLPVCSRRRILAEKHGRSFCIQSCGEEHDPLDWSWEPITRK